MNTLVAVPSENPGGLKAQVGAHFGHCEMFTLIQVKDEQILDVKTIPNVPHEQGGCLAPVNHLSEQGIHAIIAGAMGMRPLMGFKQMGIKVYYSDENQTVGDAINAFLAGSLSQFSELNTCGGGKI